MVKECKPASEIDPKNASAAGDAVETDVRIAYCASKGGCAVFPLGGMQDFVDFREFGNIEKFVAFLKANNPSIDETAIAIQFRMSKSGLKIPDLMTHQPPDRFEFYEIKPTSDVGKREGRKKILALTAFCPLNNLPYVAGVRFKPDFSRVLFVQNVGFSIVEVSLHVFWDSPGLIFWEICTEVRQREPDPLFLRVLLPMIVALALLVLLNPFKPFPPIPVPG
jgi:hypothetical protein